MLTFLLSPVVRYFMRRARVMDEPSIRGRKIHKKKIPYGGGVAIVISFFAVLYVATHFFGHIGQDVRLYTIRGMCIGIAVLLLGGFIDDKYSLRPRYQMIFPILAALVSIASGIGLESVTNPTGGMLSLNQIQFSIDGIGRLVVFADLLVFLWLMGMMYTTKLLDGLDGLVTGIAVIGGVFIFFVARQPQWFQPEVQVLAIIFAGATLGFLPWNYHPAKMFLGEGGSLMLGYMLGVLAIVSGSKIATTLLVMGVPILDVARVILMRLFKRQSPFLGDSEHLHFRLLRSGLSQKQTVWLFYLIAFLFGMSALFLQNRHQLIAFIFLFVLMISSGFWFMYKDTKI